MKYIQALPGETSEWISPIYEQDDDLDEWTSLVCSELSLGMTRIPSTKTDSTFTIHSKTDSEFELYAGKELFASDSGFGHIETLTDRVETSKVCLHQPVLKERDGLQFIDGHSFAIPEVDGITDFGSLEKRNFKILGFEDHLTDDSPFGEYQCIVNDKTKGIIASSNPMWFRDTSNWDTPRFYSFKYKSDDVEFPTVDGVKQPFVIFSDVLYFGVHDGIRRFQIMENPDRTLSIKCIYYSYTINDGINESSEITSTITLDDGWNDIKLQFIVKNDKSIDAMLYINKKLGFADNLFYGALDESDYKLINYDYVSKTFSSYNYMYDLLVIFPKNLYKVNYVTSGFVTPDNVKLAQFEFYFGIYDSENDEDEIKEITEVTYSITNDVKELYKENKTKLLVALGDSEDDLEFKTLSDVLSFNLEFKEQDKTSFNEMKTNPIDILKQRFDEENMKGKYFQFKLVMEPFDVVSTNTIFELKE
jgi:hypothetical protein